MDFYIVISFMLYFFRFFSLFIIVHRFLIVCLYFLRRVYMTFYFLEPKN